MSHVKTAATIRNFVSVIAKGQSSSCVAPSLWLLFFVFSLFAASPVSATQVVGGLAINYSQSFSADTVTANSWLSKIPGNIRPLIISLDVYVAPASNGLGEIRLMKLRYVPDLNGSIDGSATEAAQRIASLPGISNFTQRITPLVVSGIDAREVSISADRWGGKLGGEFLIIYDRKKNVLWQMQLIFAKKKSLIPSYSVNIDDERQYAKSLLSTIVVAP